MNVLTEISSAIMLSCSNKVNNLENSLQKIFNDFKELKTDFDAICMELDNYKSQFLTQKENCENKHCCSAELLSKIIEDKNKIIQIIASNLTKLSETKNFAIIEDIFKVICEDSGIDAPLQNTIEKDIKREKLTPEKVNESITDDISFNESHNEIEGTPTGRTSPIILSKTVKTKRNDNSSDYKDKKKCPEHWPTPEKKSLKLLYPTSLRGRGGGKMRQMRLSYAKTKQTSVVDLTCSPEFSGGLRCKSESAGNLEPLIVKKESVENDDTIMPSPTSGPTNFTMFKSVTKESPMKCNKPLSLKIKKEKENVSKLELEPARIEPKTEDTTHLDESANVLNKVTESVLKDFKKPSPVKLKHMADNDATHCDNSISILHQCSPSKRPLVENINTANVPHEDMESSVSLLRPEPKTKSPDSDDVKRTCTKKDVRKVPERLEPIYQEPTVRKKSEKRALPGWICEDCKNFYGVLYEDNPSMLAKMIEECSKHRGMRNPTRPKTPPNFWNPRWEVPEDTEELNRMNNAI